MSSLDDKVRIRIAEIMSSAGVGYNQISLEILYMLPRQFVDRYIDLWTQALGPLVKAPGDGMARDGELGRAPTETRLKGKVVGTGAGGAGKRLARAFSLRDEAAFNYKDTIDKRLRSIARDIRDELRLIEDRTTRDAVEAMLVTRCGRCGKVMSNAWLFCPHDGNRLIEKAQIIEEPEVDAKSMDDDK